MWIVNINLILKKSGNKYWWFWKKWLHSNNIYYVIWQMRQKTVGGFEKWSHSCFMFAAFFLISCYWIASKLMIVSRFCISKWQIVSRHKNNVPYSSTFQLFAILVFVVTLVCYLPLSYRPEWFHVNINPVRGSWHEMPCICKSTQARSRAPALTLPLKNHLPNVNIQHKLYPTILKDLCIQYSQTWSIFDWKLYIICNNKCQNYNDETHIVYCVITCAAKL